MPRSLLQEVSSSAHRGLSIDALFRRKRQARAGAPPSKLQVVIGLGQGAPFLARTRLSTVVLGSASVSGRPILIVAATEARVEAVALQFDANRVQLSRAAVQGEQLLASMERKSALDQLQNARGVFLDIGLDAAGRYRSVFYTLESWLLRRYLLRFGPTQSVVWLDMTTQGSTAGSIIDVFSKERPRPRHRWVITRRRGIRAPEIRILSNRRLFALG